MNASARGTNKSRGRPRTGQGIQIGMRWPVSVIDEIDRWAATQPDEPSRSEAILRLVQHALGGANDRQPATPPSSLTDTPNVAGESLTAVTLTTPQQPPEGGTERIKIEAEQTTRELRWTPRIVEATPQQVPEGQVLGVIGAPATETPPKAQPVAKSVEDGRPYDMPEDIKAFNEFWTRAEQSQKQSLEYEEVIVLYNRYRRAFENFFDHED